MDIALVTGTAWEGAGDADVVAELAVRADAPLRAALRERGARVHDPVWHDPDVDWSVYDLAVVRTTWDYPPRRDEFVAWAARVGAVTRLFNPPDVLRWNSHKSYLLELEERGAPVVPTAWLAQGDRVDLAALLRARDWPRAVLKPAVGAGAHGMRRVERDPPSDRVECDPPSDRVVLDPPADRVVPAPPVSGPADPGPAPAAGAADEAELGPAAAQRHLDVLLASGDAMVQPYLPTVTTRGELSVIVVDGEASHAVRKLPAPGDYRVQETRGGHYRAEPLDAEVAALARWIVESTGTDVLLARVDLIEDPAGTHQLMELELIEPDLYLGVAPEAATTIAEAILRRAAV